MLLSEAETAGLVALSVSCQVKAMPEGAAGCDGTTYSLSFASGFHSGKFTWWCDLPAAWSGLAPLVANLERLFHKAEVQPALQADAPSARGLT